MDLELPWELRENLNSVDSASSHSRLITSGTARVWVRSGDDEQEYVRSSINRDHITITSFLHKNTFFLGGAYFLHENPNGLFVSS